MLNIKPTDRVLEIGSGNRPYSRSNVLCDKHLKSNEERSMGDNVIIDERPFVVADARYLPFKDSSFDYIIASHVLEHVEDPIQVAAEFMRIAQAGYIETPSEIGEKLFGWSFHRWHVRREESTLVFRRKTEISPFGDLFHSFYHHNLLFAEFVDSRYDDFYVRYEWKGMINIRIDDSNSTVVSPNSGKFQFSSDRGIFALLVAITDGLLVFVLNIKRFLRKMSRKHMMNK